MIFIIIYNSTIIVIYNVYMVMDKKFQEFKFKIRQWRFVINYYFNVVGFFGYCEYSSNFLLFISCDDEIDFKIQIVTITFD
jgi:hypothetical protein